MTQTDIVFFVISIVILALMIIAVGMIHLDKRRINKQMNHLSEMTALYENQRHN